MPSVLFTFQMNVEDWDHMHGQAWMLREDLQNLVINHHVFIFIIVLPCSWLFSLPFLSFGSLFFGVPSTSCQVNYTESYIFLWMPSLSLFCYYPACLNLNYHNYLLPWGFYISITSVILLSHYSWVNGPWCLPLHFLLFFILYSLFKYSLYLPAPSILSPPLLLAIQPFIRPSDVLDR